MRNRVATIAAAAAASLALSAAPGGARQAAAAPPPPPDAPLEVLWRLPLPAPDRGRLAPRLAAGDALVFVSRPEGGLTAQAAGDGQTVWSSPLAAAAGPIVAGSRIAFATPETLHVLHQRTGEVAWTSPLAPGTTSLFAFGDHILAVAGRDWRAFDAAGTLLWQASPGGPLLTPVVFRQGVLFAGLEGPSLAAVDAASGAPRWNVPLRANPESLHASGDRLYLAAANGTLYSYTALGDADPAWHYRLLRAIGQPAGDDQQVYFALLDNTVSAFERMGGSKRWSRVLPTRPQTGPFLMGDRLAIAMTTGGVVELSTRDGRILAPVAPASPVRLQAATVAPDGTRLYTIAIAKDSSWTLAAWGRRAGPP